MQDVLGHEIKPGMCAVRQVKNRHDQVGFFKETSRGNLNFVRIDTKINYQTGEHELVQVKSRVQEHERFLTFNYEAQIIDHIFSEQTAFFEHFSTEKRNAAKQFFIELACANQVTGAPESAEFSREETEEEMPDYLELDGLEEAV